MNALNTAIASRLNHSSVTSLLNASNTPSSIFYLMAPDDAAFAYIIFNKMSDTEISNTAHRVANTLYQVRGFTQTSPAAAEAIANAIDARLHNATLTITGYAQLRCVRDGGVAFVENLQSTAKVYSAGGIYRIIVEKTS